MSETKLPNSVSLEFVEALYADYLRDAQSVSPDWRQYFQGLSEGNGSSKSANLAPAFKPWSIFNPPYGGATRPTRYPTSHAAGAGSGILWIDRCGHGTAFRLRGDVWRRHAAASRNSRPASQHVLPHDRCAVHAYR